MEASLKKHNRACLTRHKCQTSATSRQPSKPLKISRQDAPRGALSNPLGLYHPRLNTSFAGRLTIKSCGNYVRFPPFDVDTVATTLIWPLLTIAFCTPASVRAKSAMLPVGPY